MPKMPPSGNGESQDGISQGSDGSGNAAPSAASAPDGRPADAPGRNVVERKKKYLVAPRQSYGGVALSAFGPLAAAPLSFSTVEQALQAAPDIDVVDTVGAKNALTTASLGGSSDAVLVVRMTDNKASELNQRGQGRLLVERDYHLRLLDSVLSRPDLVSGLIPLTGTAIEVSIVVVGANGAPLPDAEVSLFGGMLPTSALTGADGVAHLQLYSADVRSINGLYVKPRIDHWSFFQHDPDISTDAHNIVKLRALSDMPSLPGFPQQNAAGWGARAMRLDQLPPQFRGQGVKVAVIDSGAATTHGNLRQIKRGFDIINKKTTPDTTWTNDELGHGSHCAGVIAGADLTYGIRGFAPEAEIHVCKLFPGGQISQLIDALEYCIENEIDVVNLSLGGGEPSEALERQIIRAKQAGVACIAAAGNSGGPVQYPAASPHVLSVAAIGKIAEFPLDSYHSETVGGDIDQQGFFTAKFSCFGPQVNVCAPGVAIVSSVPPNNFAAWDGTSMAAPHVTGLATLILAHRPEFQGVGRARSAERVERLFHIIRASARRVTLADQTRIGSGLPDALAALGVQVNAGYPAAAWQSAMMGGLAGGLDDIQPGASGLGDRRMPAFPATGQYPGSAGGQYPNSAMGQYLGGASGQYPGNVVGQYAGAPLPFAMQSLPFGYPMGSMSGGW
jgi:subtilisin family serine protease